MPAAIDGTAFIDGGSGASVATSALTTTGAGKVLVHIVSNGAAPSGVTGAGLTFTQRAVTTDTSPNDRLYVADSAGAISSQVITVNFDGTSTYATVNVFAVSGVGAFDANGSLPAASSNTGQTATVSTTSADTFIFGCFRNNVEAGTAPTDWTTARAGGFSCVHYRVYSSAQTSLTVPDSPDGANVSFIADALVIEAEPPAGPTHPFTSISIGI